MPTPIDALGSDLVDAFTGTNLLYYGGAVGISLGMAFSEADHSIRVAVQENLASSVYGDTANIAGYVLPAVVAPGLWLVGLAAHDRDVAGAGSAAIQALGVTLITTGLLKFSVGRVYPLNGGDPNAPDRLQHPAFAHTFRPFQSFIPLLAWPSGHTAATTSVVAALTGYYFPEHLWIPIVGYPIALAIGFGMIVRDDHWTSDVIAGALIGQAIGFSIGRAFRARASEPARVSLVPIVGPGMQGAGVGGVW